MLRQQLLLPVILYGWFSHTMWLVNNCTEDIKRTPVPSYQHHCQWTRIPTGEKERKNIPLHHRWLEVAHDWRENGSVLTSNQQQPTKYQHTVQTHAYDLRNIRCCVKIWIYIKHHLLFRECIIRMMFNIAMIMEMPNIKAWLGNHSNPVMKC